jgi:hypothetical protein
MAIEDNRLGDQAMAIEDNRSGKNGNLPDRCARPEAGTDLKHQGTKR